MAPIIVPIATCPTGAVSLEVQARPAVMDDLINGGGRILGRGKLSASIAFSLP